MPRKKSPSILWRLLAVLRRIRDASVRSRPNDLEGNTASELLTIGDKLIRSGHGAEADAVLGAGRSLFPENAELASHYAFAAHSRGAHAEAVRRWTVTVERFPSFALNHYCLAANLRELGRVDRAKVVIDAALMRFPGDANTIAEAARVASAGKRWSEAVALWDRALAAASSPGWRQARAAAAEALTDGEPEATRPPGSLRIVAITRILDEADLVEAFVRHTSAFVSQHVFVDNGSRDDTLRILQALHAESFGITVFQNRSVSFNEEEFNTFMFRHAATKLEADWVICLDVDEFIDDRDAPEGFIEAVATAGREHEGLVYGLPLFEYENASDDDATEIVVPRRLRRRAPQPVTTKVLARAEVDQPGMTVDAGNHAILVDDRALPSASLPGIRLAHYPRRSPEQMAVKNARGYAKVIAAGPAEVARGRSLHYKGLYELLRDNPLAFFGHGQVKRPPEADASLILDPIDYRGGPLRYTVDRAAGVWAVSVMLGYVDDLARQHGLLIAEVPEARARVEASNRDLRLLFAPE